MEILAKSLINKKQLDAKIKDGTNKIEIQLLEDFIDENISIRELFQETLKSNVVIYNVHAPLTNEEDFNLEYFSQDLIKKIFLKCCELSQEYAYQYNREINIIVHNSFTLQMYKSIPLLLNEIISIFEKVIIKYPDVIISFENIIPFSLKKNFYGRAGFLKENVDLANYFNNICSKPIFGTTLDICHALTTLKCFEMFKGEPMYDKYNLNMEYFFMANKDTINNIHLCNLKNIGLGYMEHGTSFDISEFSDFKILHHVIELYRKYEYNALMTLEVIEENYLNCKNFRKTKESLEYILQEYN